MKKVISTWSIYPETQSNLLSGFKTSKSELYTSLNTTAQTNFSNYKEKNWVNIKEWSSQWKTEIHQGIQHKFNFVWGTWGLCSNPCTSITLSNLLLFYKLGFSLSWLYNICTAFLVEPRDFIISIFLEFYCIFSQFSLKPPQ